MKSCAARRKRRRLAGNSSIWPAVPADVFAHLKGALAAMASFRAVERSENLGWGKDFQAFWVGLVIHLTSAEFVFLLMVSNPYVV